jgi:hypothetical protein
MGVAGWRMRELQNKRNVSKNHSNQIKEGGRHSEKVRFNQDVIIVSDFVSTIAWTASIRDSSL